MGKLRLQRLRLKNIKQHRDLDRLFSAPDGTPARLIGVVGPNGSGKSGILDSLSWLFTGESGELNKDELVSWPGGSDALVEGFFLYDGAPLRLMRSASSAKAEMEFGGKLHSGITAVNREVKEQLGIDRELCQQSIFVRQKTIDDILFTEPAERRKAWHKLMGLARAEQIHAALGVYISALPPETDYAREMESLTGHVASYRRAMHALRAELVPEVPARNMAEAERRLAAATLVSSRRRELEGLSARMTADMEEIRRLEAAVRLLEQGLATMRVYRTDVPELASAIDALSVSTAKAKSSRTAYAVLETEVLPGLDLTGREISVLEAALAKTDPSARTRDAEELARLNDDVSKDEGETSLLNRLMAPLKTADHRDICPLCQSRLEEGSDLENQLAARIAELRDRAARTRDSANRLRTRLEAADAAERETRARLEAFRKTEAALLAKRDALAERVELLLDPSELQAMEDELAGKRTEMAAAANAAEALRNHELKLERTRAELERTSRSLADTIKAAEAANRDITAQAAVAGLEAGETPETAMDRLRSEIRRMQEAGSRRADQLGEWRGLRKAATSSLDALRTLRLEAGAEEERQRRIRKLTEVRSFFHYSKGPHMMVSRLLDDTTDAVNGMLQYFSAPFIVQPDFSTLDFRCVFTDGRPVPAEPPHARKVLSGGEKIELALAFRLASYQMFAARTGFMTLDEPTVYLDENNVENFGNLLERLRGLLSETDLQVLISTHERTVMSRLDYVIDLGNNNT